MTRNQRLVDKHQKFSSSTRENSAVTAKMAPLQGCGVGARSAFKARNRHSIKWAPPEYLPTYLRHETSTFLMRQTSLLLWHRPLDCLTFER